MIKNRKLQKSSDSDLQPSSSDLNVTIDENQEKEITMSDTNKDGVTDMAEAVAGGEEHMAAQKEHADEVAATEAARRAALSPETRGEVHGDLYAVGFAPSTDMTSPGGPWNGLPVEASTDPNHPDWAENCRWACVQGSFFACTFDGSTTIGDKAENVRGFGIPTEEGAAYMRSISTLPPDQKVNECIERGNEIVYNGLNVGYTKS
jgi:hypothetical protein